MIDLLLHPLDTIVPVCRPMVGSWEHYFAHLLGSLDLAQVQQESCLEVFERFQEETRKAWSCHKADEVVYMLMVSSRKQKTFDHKSQVQLKRFAFYATSHNVYHLFC